MAQKAENSGAGICAFTGAARLVGDDVNTDYIISSRRKRVTIDADVLRGFLFEDYDKDLGASIQPGEILVAGHNFGCGSAMEVAVTVIRAAGVSCVLAQSFARAYYRNAINNGLMPVICDSSSIEEGDKLEITMLDDGLKVINLTKDRSVETASFSPIIMEILNAGGIAPYLCTHGDFPETI
jgi:3-isopropylmalate/(R)-2-methylmalate dehydratase small subunit